MATIDDFIKHGKNGWKLFNCYSKRRQLFHDKDRLVFTKIDERCALVDAKQIKNSSWSSALGARILCRLDGGNLTATDHGRHMVFAIGQAAPDAPWRLTYQGTFVEGIVSHPDEGGDGDPDPT